MAKAQNIILVGLMGSGKSTIGRHLAKSLELEFVDSDHEIERRTGANIPLIFDVEGEAGFRQREKKVIDELTQRRGVVLATGGGAVLDPENRARLRERGKVIYLYATAEQLLSRTAKDRNRPLLQTADPRARQGSGFVGRHPSAVGDSGFLHRRKELFRAFVPGECVHGSARGARESHQRIRTRLSQHHGFVLLRIVGLRVRRRKNRPNGLP